MALQTRLASLPFAISVIIAARNEAALIGRCLTSLVNQTAVPNGPVEVIVAVNGTTDQTASKAKAFADTFSARGWSLRIIDLAAGGKLGALNAAEAAASGRSLAYLDADVVCDAGLLAEVDKVLVSRGARYATGRIAVMPAASIITRAYSRLWVRLPFVRGGAVGAGFFAVNREGRARWAEWPAIISDDTFVRLQFTPAERIEVDARYHWPMVEGFRNLVRVRRRQDAGVIEIRNRYPAIMENEAKARLTKGDLLRLALTEPLGFAVYSAVHVAVRLGSHKGDWTRGR